VGLLIAAVGSARHGWALRRDGRLDPATAIGVAALGLIWLVGGVALVGHIPSGPGVGWVLGALLLGLAGFRTEPEQPPRLREKT
jgi:uncharacterized membrane protein YfcA